MSDVKGREMVDLHVGIPGASLNSKNSKGWGGRGVCEYLIQHTVGWTTCNTLPFCSENSGPLPITTCSREKRYLSPHIHTPEQGSLGARLLF